MVRDVVCCAAADVGRTVLEMRLVRTALRSLGLDRVSGEVAAAAFCEVTKSRGVTHRIGTSDSRGSWPGR